MRLCGPVFVATLLASTPAFADMNGDKLNDRPADRVVVFVVRGEGVTQPITQFQEAARDVLEQHMYVRASIDDSLALQKQLAACRGDDACYARLVGSANATYLLVLAISQVGDRTAVGARFIDLAAVSALGSSVDAVPAGEDVIAKLKDGIRKAVPAQMWDPFGRLTIIASVEGAEVTVNGRVIGVAPVDVIGRLLPGRYEVGSSKLGFTPASVQAAVERGRHAEARVTLQPAESGSTWWIWAVVGVVAVAGAATAIGLATSGGDPDFCSSPDIAQCN